MRFTIAIPTYNNVNTIEKSIGSAINQIYNEDFEVLVVDNCSTDGTDKLLDSYKEKVTTIRNNTTVSIYENHNICIKDAKGDYIIFCHSDDQLLPDALSKYYNILKKRNFPNRYVLWGRSMFRDFYSNWNSGGFYLNEIASGINSIDVFLGGGLTPSGTCYSRKSLLKLGGFVLVYHKLAPSDLVTMWKLSLNHFEFEMTDRIFYNREYASTATELNFSYDNKKDSISEAINCLKLDLEIDKFDMLIEKFKRTTNFSPFLFNVLIEDRYLKRSHFKKRAFKAIIKNPLWIKNKDVRKILFK